MHRAALGALGTWSRRQGDAVSHCWVLSDRVVMVMCEETTTRTLPRSLRVERHPRTTRWAMLTRVRGGQAVPRSRLFPEGRELVVLPAAEQASDGESGVMQTGIEPDGARLRVLGVRRDEQSLAVGTLPRAWLEPPRVGKLDHPALLWQLAAQGYWPATSAAHAEATALAHALRRRWDGATEGART